MLLTTHCQDNSVELNFIELTLFMQSLTGLFAALLFLVYTCKHPSILPSFLKTVQ